MPTNEKSVGRWVRRTRESVARALVEACAPESALTLVDNLDITTWSSIGVLGRRTQREISSALQWLVQQGYAESMKFTKKDYDYTPGVHYSITPAGVTFAKATRKDT